jgi:hypothetical protein
VDTELLAPNTVQVRYCAKHIYYREILCSRNIFFKYYLDRSDPLLSDNYQINNYLQVHYVYNTVYSGP